MRILTIIAALGMATFLIASPIGSLTAQDTSTDKEVRKEKADDDHDRYYSRDYRFSIVFPQKWEIASDEDVTSLGAISERESGSDAFRENILVGSFDLGGQAYTLQQYFDGNMEYLKEKVPDIKVVSTKNIKVGDSDAIKVVYTSTIDGQQYETVQVFLIKDGRGFIITAMGEEKSFDKFSGEFDAAVSSFRFEQE
jgi:hypothetical protein